jgi:hypothetical protein
MKWELDDNTSDGIRFLLIGAGSLLVLRFCYSGVVKLLSAPPQGALAEACVHFQSGYWISDPHAVVLDGGAGIGTRLALTVMITVVVALALAGLTHLLTSTAKQSNGSWAVRLLRVALVVPFCWWLFAALTQPPTEVHFDSTGFSVQRRPALFGALSLPLPTDHTAYNWADFEAVSTTKVEQGAAVITSASEDTMILAVGGSEDAHSLALALRSLAGKP